MHRKKSSLAVLLTRVVGEFLVKNFGLKVYYLLLLYIISSSQDYIAQTWNKHYVYLFMFLLIVTIFQWKQTGTFIFRIFTCTTMIFSNAIGPVEHMTLCGHPVAFMAPSIYGQPQVSHPCSYIQNICPLILLYDNNILNQVSAKTKLALRLFILLHVSSNCLDFCMQALTVHYHNYGSDIKVVLAVDDTQFQDCHQLLDDFVSPSGLLRMRQP